MHFDISSCLLRAFAWLVRWLQHICFFLSINQNSCANLLLKMSEMLLCARYYLTLKCSIFSGHLFEYNLYYNYHLFNYNL